MAADRLHSEIEEAANDWPSSYRRGETIRRTHLY